MNPWLGIMLMLGVLGAMMAGLRLYRERGNADPERVRKLLHVGMGLAALALPWLFREMWPVLTLMGLATLLMLALRFVAPLRRRWGGVVCDVERDSLGELYFAPAIALVFFLSHGDPLL